MIICTEKQQRLIAEAEAVLAGNPAAKLLDGQPVGDTADPGERRTAIDAILASYDLCVDWNQEFWEGQHVVPKSRYQPGMKFGSPYLTGVPRIRLLRPARPDPVGRPHGALAAAPFLATFRERLRRGSLLACRAARPGIAGQFAASPFPRPFPSSAAFASPKQIRCPVSSRVSRSRALRGVELRAAFPHIHGFACELQ